MSEGGPDARASAGIDDTGLRRLLLLPVAWIVVLAAGAALFPGPALTIFFRVSLVSAKVIWLYACVFAALAFQPGDYLRGAWFYYAAACFGVLVRDATLLISVEDPA